MKRVFLAAVIGCAALVATNRLNAATVTVDPAATWNGFMNVFELPANGGGFVFGSGWGTADLVATFSGNVLTLAPNSVNDVAEFWYQGGAPGNPGNKIMEANMYVEATTTLSGQTVTFEGTILSNSLTSAHSAVVFIKDFAPDYSSNVPVTIPVTPGPFSISLDTLPGAGRHVQYGFAMTGPNVWITDVAPFGNVQIAAVPEPTTLALAGAGLLGTVAMRRRRPC